MRCQAQTEISQVELRDIWHRLGEYGAVGWVCARCQPSATRELHPRVQEVRRRVVTPRSLVVRRAVEVARRHVYLFLGQAWVVFVGVKVIEVKGR